MTAATFKPGDRVICRLGGVDVPGEVMDSSAGVLVRIVGILRHVWVEPVNVRHAPTPEPTNLGAVILYGPDGDLAVRAEVHGNGCWRSLGSSFFWDQFPQPVTVVHDGWAGDQS